MLKLISSMATRPLLVELAGLWQQASGVEVSIESVGGVDAARRVHAGEAFDGVVLALDAIEKLIAGGQVLAAGRCDLARSCVALAVKAGMAVPDISTEAALRSAVEAAPSIGYSTGPSGVALVKLFERWGMWHALQARIVQAPPGVPVGLLLARGEVALGFQQLSELMHIEGISVVGTLPGDASITTVFSAAICAVSSQPKKLAQFLNVMQSSDTTPIKQRHGMDALATPAAR